ncbi:hypothetical protein AWM75_04700 [Aerococcus urinaehominis]|uniref:Membrane protein insertase YidC n=1 Tax=Aerococcus urinaehominis TaxID=128944 RepID=A0A109RID2_9LACT|nr:membrane protein insertase YidC [Aerococcus urinaehominis]AMC00046.1 hypothetical protein AWM75_04700 [Aerococcus urinaehominis]
MKEKISSTKLKLAGLLASVSLFLAACATSTEPINAQSTGFWDRYIVYNMSRLIIWLSEAFGGNYGIGIILITLIIRVLLIPLMQYQMKSQEKMQEVQPEIQALQEKYASKDPETQEQLRIEMAKLQEEHDYNPWAGCLPMLIQLPILMALYQSISRTEILRQEHFLWFQLGQPDPYFILPIIAACLTWYSMRLNTVANPAAGKGQMAMMQWTMPAMILFMGLGLPSAISLYWVANTGFTVLQTLLLNNPYKKREARLAEEAKTRDLERRLEKARRNPRGKKR